MNIYDNGFLKLDYESSTDILSVIMPPVNDILLPEIARSFSVIVEHVRNYDIKNLLVDARETQVEVEESVFTPILSAFAEGLAATRLEKVARISSPSPTREYLILKTFQERKMPIIFESFTDPETAIEWLKR